MIVDAEKLPTSAPLRYDLCIIGAGAAGIAIANELASSSLRICVLESGKKVATTFADSLKQVSTEGIPIKENSR